MKVDSQEFKDLMAKWSDEAYQDELEIAEEEYFINEDMHGRLEEG